MACNHLKFAVAVISVAVISAWLGCPNLAPAAEPNAFATGSALEERLAAPVSVSWSNTPLRQALASLSTSQHLAIVLDRRVDPEQSVQLLLSQEPLRASLARIAEHLHLGYCQLGPIAYLGPPAMAARLRTLAAQHLEEIRPLSVAGSRKLLILRDSHWDDLAEPRQLLRELAAEAGVQVVGAEQIPHDLWPAADWPQMTWLDRMTLLLAQFDLAFRITDKGRAIELVPAPADPVVTRTYDAGKNAKTIEKRWAKALPKAQLALEGNKIRLAGRVEDHELVEQRFRGTATDRPTVTAGQEFFQLSIENGALNRVAQQLSQRLNLEFRWDQSAIEAAGISLDQIISVNVQHASLDELLKAVFKDTGLTYQRADRVISVTPIAK
jgi:hypothetical protein